MYRIDDATAAAALPTPGAAGTEGFFTEGSPTAGQAATIVTADFLNMLQEELRAIVVAGGLTPSKANNAQLLSAIKALTGGRLIGVQVFNATGTYIPTPGMATAIVEVQGAGGGGGGTQAAGSTQISVAGGGGSGSYGKSRFTAAAIGASVTVTVGIAGVPLAGVSGPGGGATSFGTLLSAAGGNGAAVASPVSSSATYAALGGSASALPTGAGILSLPGVPGGIGLLLGLSIYSGAGGGSPISVGAGGGSQSGVGANGAAAVTAGSGGGGAATGNSDIARPGGAGANGKVIVWEYA